MVCVGNGVRDFASAGALIFFVFSLLLLLILYPRLIILYPLFPQVINRLSILPFETLPYSWITAQDFDPVYFFGLSKNTLYTNYRPLALGASSVSK